MYFDLGLAPDDIGASLIPHESFASSYFDSFTYIVDVNSCKAMYREKQRTSA